MFEGFKLEILYHDDDLIAINKPSGLLVHKSFIDKDEQYFAMQLLRDQIGKWVYPIHRLDKPTSGVLVFALSSEIAKMMATQFESHTIIKRYLTVVRGWTPKEGMIDHPLKEKLDITDKKANQNKPPQKALTYYKTLSTTELPFAISRYDTVRYSLVELFPKTGRKHQLRRHMKHISHHILGDTKYGRGEHNKLIRKEFGVHRLLLHCASMQIEHPITKEKLYLEASLDDIFRGFLEKSGLVEWALDEYVEGFL